jgi:Protocatechuate 3,4-dioxygenase beta subunit N terminal
VRQQPTDETVSLGQEDNGQPPYLYPDYVARRLRAPKKPLIILLDLETTQPEWALGYRFDIVLEGREAIPMENHR